MAHAAALPARRNALFHQDAFTVAMVATLLAAGILFTGLWGASQLLTSGHIAVATTLDHAAAQLEDHAKALPPDRAADATMLTTLAARLRQDALLLGDDPASNTYASASLLTMKASQLEGDANALESRGMAMADATMLDCADQLRDTSASLTAAAEQMRGMLRR